MSRWVLIISIILAAIAYSIAFLIVDVTDIFHSATNLDPRIWILALSLSLVNYGLRFLRWHIYLFSLGHQVPPVRHLAIYLSGFALTPTPGKLGECLRALYLKQFRVGYARSISVLYTERLLDLIAVSLLSALLFFTETAEFRWIALVGGSIAGILLALQHPAALRAACRLSVRLPQGVFRRLSEKMVGFQRDVTSLLRAPLLAVGLALGITAWAAEGIGLYYIAQALEIDVGMAAALGIYAAAMLAGALSFIPAGLGSAEATIAVMLVLAGAPLSDAVVATGVVRLATLWFAVALGAATWFGMELARPPRTDPRMQSEVSGS